MTATRSNNGDLAKWYELNKMLFCMGKAKCVDRFEKTDGFSSRGWAREKAGSHQRPGGYRNILRRRLEKVTPEVEAGVSRLWYRPGVCPKRMQSDRGH